MKIVLTCGHPHSGYPLAHQVLVDSGLAPARPSRRELFSAAELLEKIFKANELDVESEKPVVQLSPGKIWQDLAADLLIGNLDHENWGWADSRNLWLLDFWKAFDPQTRFVLVYSTPEFAVGQMLRNTQATPQKIAQAVESWLAANTELLRFYHRNQDVCQLINISAVLQTPSVFVEKISASWGLKLVKPASDYRPDRIGISTIAASLARELIEERADATELYRELESSADLGAAAPVAEGEKRQAWQEYLELLAKPEQAPQPALKSTHPDEEFTQLEARNQDLAQENELLLLQLHQVQEELEHYFLKYQEIAGKGQKHQGAAGKDQQNTGPATFLTRFWHEHQPNEILIDLRGEIEGDNWYYPEEDGRWAGPELASTLRLPALRDGRYNVTLDIVDAMEPEILSGMELSLNGTPLEITEGWEGYQELRCARFKTSEISASSVWEFQFKFPGMVSPAQRGSDDERKLGIRLRSLKLNTIECPFSENPQEV